MRASGLFHLTIRPTQAQLTSPNEGAVRGWQLNLVERYGDRREHRLCAYWRGAEADTFMVQHWGSLKAGCSLNLELEHLRVANGELRARVVSCALAPARWEGRSAAAIAAISALRPRVPAISTPRPAAA